MGRVASQVASRPVTTMPSAASLYRRSRSSRGSFWWVAPLPLLAPLLDSLTSSLKASLPSRPDSCSSFFSCFWATCVEQT